VRQGRREGEANGLRRTGVLLSVALVAAAFVPHAHAADDSGSPSSPPAALVFASTASIAPEVPETAGETDAATPVDESAAPSDPPAAPVTITVAKKPANNEGWVEVRAVLSRRAPSVIPTRRAAVRYARPPVTPPAVQRAAAERRVPQYHRRPAQYHAAARSVGPSQPTRALLVPMHRHDGELTSADEAPSDGSQDPGDTCPSEPSICPDLCGDVLAQNSLQNIAEIVRCIVNAVTQEIGSGDNGSLPDSGAQVPAPVAGDTSDGQYHCDDPQYQCPPCEQSTTAATPAAPPAGTPAPDAAPTATPTTTPTSGSTTGPSAPAGATSPGPSPTRGAAADTSNAEDGWQLVHAAPQRPPARHTVLAAASVPATSPHEVVQARVVAAVPRSPKAEHPARRLVPGLRGGHQVALATAASASAPSDSDAWPLRTMIALLALASLGLALAAVAKVNGGVAAASVRARLGSKALSRGAGFAAKRKRGVRYRE
jgi:hypothetical protein